MLLDLHGGHPGVSHVKSLARGLVWRPNQDREIENIVGWCLSCQQCESSPLLAHMQCGGGQQSPGRISILTLLDL